ncbi:hypothetical protein [Stigmatella erecta]|uniref:Uncharacterized protein n=1 Tax=Stigmatella erecta TaxID=83460 RepID=A0A1H9ZR01_9BACT|nr:hypothetical protein [Stigmatella erecta]SES84229.1 hypothetical protein SAMN05443639_101400 [Stigmatella erecta]
MAINPKSPPSDLFLNALEAIENGIEDFATRQPQRTSSALRNLYAGVLLLLKEKLRRLSPAGTKDVLIYTRFSPRMEGGNKVTLVGSGMTVDFKEIRARFKDLGLSADWKRLERLQDMRNHVEHHKPAHSAESISEAITHTFIIVVRVLEDHLETIPADVLTEETWKVMLAEAEIFKTVEHTCREARQSLQGVPEETEGLINHHILCPECASSLLKPSKEDFPECLFVCQGCGESSSASSVVNDALDRLYGADEHMNIQDGGERSFDTCPSCSEGTFLVDKDICALCGGSRFYKQCRRCETSLSLDEQDLSGFCGYCYHMANKND